MQNGTQIEALLDFWFGELDETGWPATAQQKLWFNPPAGTDEAISRRFGREVEHALAGSLDHWADSDSGLVALMLLLDQLTRNVFRGTPLAFSGDPQALALARKAWRGRLPADMPVIHRVFLCLPFEHAEDLAAQDEGIACMDRLISASDAHLRPRIAEFRRYMVAHRDVIARFGRFPHRNDVLGRTSSAAELAWLEKHGGF